LVVDLNFDLGASAEENLLIPILLVEIDSFPQDVNIDDDVFLHVDDHESCQRLLIEMCQILLK